MNEKQLKNKTVDLIDVMFNMPIKDHLDFGQMIMKGTETPKYSLSLKMG